MLLDSLQMFVRLLDGAQIRIEGLAVPLTLILMCAAVFAPRPGRPV